MSFQHLYAMLLPVQFSMDPSGVDVDRDKVAEALRQAADAVAALPEGQTDALRQIIGRPVETRIEDRWAYCHIEDPDLIYDMSDQAFKKHTGKPQSMHTLDAKRAAALDLSGGFWCRPADVSRIRVLGTLYGDDGEQIGHVDLAECLAHADLDQLLASIGGDWDVSAILDDCEDDRDHPLYGQPHLVDDADEREAFLKIAPEHRNHALKHLMDLHPERRAEISAIAFAPNCDTMGP